MLPPSFLDFDPMDLQIEQDLNDVGNVSIHINDLENNGFVTNI